MSQERGSRRQATFLDHYQAVANGRATAFERRFVDLADSGHFSMTDPVGEVREQQCEGASGLEDKRVHFAGEDGEYQVAFPEDQPGDEELLTALEGRLPWEGLLPDGPVERGDEWALEPALLAGLMAPGGDLAFDDDGAELPPLSVREPAVPVGAEYEGEIQASFGGVESEGGTTLARISLLVEVTAWQDLTEFAAVAEELPEDAPPNSFASQTESVTQETSYSGSGTLLWNLDQGRLERLELELDVLETQDVVSRMGDGYQAMELHQVMVHSGEVVLEVEVEVRSSPH